MGKMKERWRDQQDGQDKPSGYMAAAQEVTA
jgi:hypothetical protein